MHQESGDTMTLTEYIEAREQFIASLIYLSLRAKGIDDAQANDLVMQEFKRARELWMALHSPELLRAMGDVTLPKQSHDFPPRQNWEFN